MTEMHNFSEDKQRAIEQMLNMNRRAKEQGKSTQNEACAPLRTKSSADIGRFSDLLNQPDTLLIIGLILILAQENADMLLIFALVYILS